MTSDGSKVLSHEEMVFLAGVEFRVRPGGRARLRQRRWRLRLRRPLKRRYQRAGSLRSSTMRSRDTSM